ncbi:MAG TPA: amidohydrolase family protein [Azospirillaceae bacterium]|nr:amidohydrolase family protein [Azospirillaceae bacterium]
MLDCHHHLWKADRGDYHWMGPQVPVLCRDYLADDLAPLLRKAGVERTILVQAAQTEAETDFLLEIAAGTDFVAGVTGWLDLDDPGFPDRLAHYRRHPKFVAVRPMLQDIGDDAWILRPTVLENLGHLAATGFPLEFLTYPRHLPHVITALQQVPGLRAVVDHLSKPPIASGRLEPWATLLARVAAFPNVHCKLSGMVTEADHGTWSPAALAPYVEHAVSVFGPDRLMYGSDWPVCRLAAEYGEVIHALRLILGARLGPADLDKIFRTNGARFYGLEAGR